MPGSVPSQRELFPAVPAAAITTILRIFTHEKLGASTNCPFTAKCYNESSEEIPETFLHPLPYGTAMEQRHYFRAKATNTEIHISDRAGFCVGILKDFSRFGLCITDIPRKIHTEGGYFIAVLSCDNINFRLKVEERWSVKEGLATVIGAVIENVPWDWTEMVMQHEPQSNDVWTTR